MATSSLLVSVRFVMAIGWLADWPAAEQISTMSIYLSAELSSSFSLFSQFHSTVQLKVNQSINRFNWTLAGMVSRSGSLLTARYFDLLCSFKASSSKPMPERAAFGPLHLGHFKQSARQIFTTPKPRLNIALVVLVVVPPNRTTEMSSRTSAHHSKLLQLDHLVKG